MTAEEALNILEEILGTRRLSKAQELVFRQAWEGHSYMQIANSFDYDYGYIKDTGAELWQMLSTALGQKVTKFNFQIVLKRYVNRESQPTNQPALEQSEVANLSPPIDAARPTEADEVRWVGREPLVDALTQKIQGNCRILALVGITGVGKSALAARLSLESGITQTWPAVKLIRFDGEQCTFEQFAHQILGTQVPSAPESKQNSRKLVIDLVTHLQNHPCLLILDMVEEILEAGDRGKLRYKDGLFAQFFDQVITAESMPSRLIMTSQDQPPIMAEGRYLERSQLEWLKGLNTAESLELFTTWEVYPKTEEACDYLQRIIQVYEGHPLALRVIAGEIRETPYCGDIQAYWHDYGQEIVAIEQQQQAASLCSNTDSMTLVDYSINLTDLVKCRIERTLNRLHTSSPLSYVLLCMGATYRCSVERTAWLILIMDSPREAQITAFQTLQRRSLLETDRTVGRVLYRLHSLIRSVALQHLAKLESGALL